MTFEEAQEFMDKKKVPRKSKVINQDHKGYYEVRPFEAVLKKKEDEEIYKYSTLTVIKEKWVYEKDGFGGERIIVIQLCALDTRPDKFMRIGYYTRSDRRVRWEWSLNKTNILKYVTMTGVIAMCQVFFEEERIQKENE